MNAWLLAICAAVSLAATPAEVAPRPFRDCADCPEMVVVPAGRFVMGSPPAEKAWAASRGAAAASVADEAPQHPVSLRSFALGRYDVTRGQYAAFVRATGYPLGDGCGANGEKWNKVAGLSWQAPGFRQTDRDPVVCVSWQDAQAYLRWLNRKVDRRHSGGGVGPYRLPSEAEWEYAARAGATTAFWWGDDEAGAATHAWYGARFGRPPIADVAGGQTHPVGSKPANPFGLYDMAGNVGQWTADCYAESYVGAPSDGRPVDTPAGCLRVDRGGSWLYAPWLLRSAARERNPADYRDSIMGFRVARTLP